MTVHRRVVEVRTEVVDGILRLRADEELAAQPDNRLLCSAVTVVRIPFAVERNELLVVVLRPEDVVRKEAVTVVGGDFRNLRCSDGTVPDEGGNAVERAWRGGEVVQRRAVLALPRDDVLIPEPAQQMVVLDREVNAVLRVLAEPRVDGRSIAASQDQVHASIGEVLQHREVFGDLDRVVGGDQRRRGREDDAFRLCRDVSKGGGG